MKFIILKLQFSFPPPWPTKDNHLGRNENGTQVGVFQEIIFLKWDVFSVMSRLTAGNMTFKKFPLTYTKDICNSFAEIIQYNSSLICIYYSKNKTHI